MSINPGEPYNYPEGSGRDPCFLNPKFAHFMCEVFQQPTVPTALRFLELRRDGAVLMPPLMKVLGPKCALKEISEISELWWEMGTHGNKNIQFFPLSQLSGATGSITHDIHRLLLNSDGCFKAFKELMGNDILFFTSLESFSIVKIAFFICFLPQRNPKFFLRHSHFPKENADCTEIPVEALPFATGKSKLGSIRSLLES